MNLRSSNSREREIVSPCSVAPIRASSIIKRNEQYAFMTDSVIKRPKFIAKQDSYKRLFGDAFGSGVTRDEFLKGRQEESNKGYIDREEQFKKFIYSANHKDDEYYYSKFSNIYRSEERKRFNKKYIGKYMDEKTHNKMVNERLKQMKGNDVFVGMKDFILKTGINAFREKVDNEKNQRMHMVRKRINDIAQKGLNKFKIKRKNQKIIMKRNMNKNQFIERGKSFVYHHSDSKSSYDD